MQGGGNFGQRATANPNQGPFGQKGFNGQGSMPPQRLLGSTPFRQNQGPVTPYRNNQPLGRTAPGADLEPQRLELPPE